MANDNREIKHKFRSLSNNNRKFFQLLKEVKRVYGNGHVYLKIF